MPHEPFDNRRVAIDDPNRNRLVAVGREVDREDLPLDAGFAAESEELVALGAAHDDVT